MPTFHLNIFLPAAGLGERLRPVTRHMPKPLLPILGRPIIETILSRLTEVCDGRIGINLHYKPEMIQDWAGSSRWADRITFFPEDPILGTGGALKNAETFLSSGPFIVHNSDILLEIDFSRLIEEHISSGNTATLVCHRLPHLSNVVIDKNGQVLDVENPGDSRPDPNTNADKVAYTGIAVYSPEILRFLPAGVSHATVAWIAASKAGLKVRAMDFTGCYWNDVGTPQTYARAVLDALRKDGETVYISPSAKCASSNMDGYVVVEGGTAIEDGSRIRNCIVMPGAYVTGDHENRIIGPDYIVSLTESDMQPGTHAAQKKRVFLAEPLFAHYFGIVSAGHGLSSTPNSEPRATNPELPTPESSSWSDAILIGLGGSDRRYYRVRNDSMTAVLMECRPDDPDYERHLIYTRFFEGHHIPVPALYSADEPSKRALFEDLGDTSLYSYMKLPRGNSHIEDVYRRVLDIAVRLHTEATDHISECPLLRARIFDYDYLRWETTYFLDRFVLGLKKIDVEDREALEEEFHRLAQKVDAFPKGVIHRDFQCQNIIMTKGRPRVIDFQGARMAPAAYDVASILWDPYYRLDDRVREKLLDYYIAEMKKKQPGRFDEKTFIEGLLPCRLQRHMQALGAYGFLSVVKGKRYFLKYVPEALRLLKQETEICRKEYPLLHRLVQDLG